MSAEVTMEIPTYPDGHPLSIGDRIRMADGSLVLVRALVFTDGGNFVSAHRITKDTPGMVPVDSVVESPDTDDQESLEADALLSVNDYLKKRAIPLDGKSTTERAQAKSMDLLARQRRIDAMGR